MKIGKYRFLLLFSIFSFAISAFSFVLIPLSDFRGSGIKKITAYMVGVLFWLGLILGLVITVKLGSIRKKSAVKINKFPGLICFFKNKPAICSDFAMIASIIVFLIFQRLFGLYSIISVLFLSFTVFFIYMHSVFNGSNYAYAFQKGEIK